MKKNSIVVIIFIVIFFAGFGCKAPSSKYQVDLDFWGTFDNSNVYDEIFGVYKNIDQNILQITYRKNTIESYKEDLLSALAAGNGPDIFMIHNSWMPDFQDKIVPVPDYMMTEQEFRDNFVDVAAEDCIINRQIYGVPLSVDSLALYYNKDIFNAVGITRPPRTWEEFNKDVQLLTKIDEFGNIKQSGAALGTAFNVNRSSDILTVMMLQHKTEMSDKDKILFDESVSFGAGLPSEIALKQYTDFASAASSVYTWNKRQNYSIDAFFQENAAMMINYSWHYNTLKAKNAKLNFAVSDLPQLSFDNIGDQANFANYWILVVAKNKQPKQNTQQGVIPITNKMRVHESWQFLKALTFPMKKGIKIQNAMSGESLIYNNLEFDFTEKYLENTGKPAARRDLVEKQKTDVRLGAFARGNLIAHSWWRNNADDVVAIFADMIDSVNTGRSSIHDAIQLGASRAKQFMK